MWLGYDEYVTQQHIQVIILSLVDIGVYTHHCDVIMGTVSSKIISIAIVYSTFIQTQIKENIKAPRHFTDLFPGTGDRWIPRTNGQ